jgi:glycerate kinase
MDRKNDGLRLMDGAGYKKIIIACDSYKGCLSSREVNEAIASGVKVWNADDASPEMNNLISDTASPEIITLEMSDGGEGMLDAFLSAMKGERVRIHAHDALMRWIEAEYGIVDDTAIIEIAQTAGLALIEPEQRNPMKATSWGVGEMIMNAYRRGVRRFIVGLGGSATSDCGIGMFKAMGDDWKKIRQECSFVLASDVTNPLCGENGAAHVFAPQKGADAKMVQMLDDRASKFAQVSAKHFGYDRSEAPGAGAAGGLGYAFLQYFNAEARPGAELLLEKIEVDVFIQDADLVITGEGNSDRQTLMGKLPQRILEHVTNQKIWLVSGGVSDRKAMLDAGFDRVVQVTPEEMPLDEAMKPEVARNNIIKVIREQFAL